MHYDTIIIGAGAAGLMCAGIASQRGKKVLVLDHAKSPGEKIRISGGGRCNFTNIHAAPEHFLSENPRFCISALKRFTQQDFIALVKKHKIAHHEKTLGQLFCDDSSQQIIDMLLAECSAATLQMNTPVRQFTKDAGGMFHVDNHTANTVVIATGGLSIPKMGATGWGYDIAKQFSIKTVPTRAGLVPFTLTPALEELAGVSAHSIISCHKKQFEEAMLFTHRGLSGPAMLQISSYWKEGDAITMNLLPHQDLFTLLKNAKIARPKQDVQTVLAEYLPKRLVHTRVTAGKLADLPHTTLQHIADSLQRWQIKPTNTEGYRTAEVTLGGVSTDALSSTTMETKSVPGLYFIGEVVDVTGHLGGFNFQWAWSSGYAAGVAV